jgi:hypothetical protein
MRPLEEPAERAGRMHLPVLRYDSERALAALRVWDRPDEGIGRIATTTRKLWYSIFDPQAGEDDRVSRNLAVRHLFGAFAMCDLHRFREVWNSDRTFRLKDLLRCGNEQGGQDAVRPKGRMIVPIMVDGIIGGAFLYGRPMSRFFGIGFALVGYSSGRYSRHRFPDGSRYAGAVRVGPLDLGILKANAGARVLVIDDTIVSGDTMDSVTRWLRSTGSGDIDRLDAEVCINNDEYALCHLL